MFMLLVVARESAYTKEVDLGEGFKIKNGREAVVREKKLWILFKSVSNDSRCATGATCVWEGNAAIEIEVSKKNAPTVATLSIWLGQKESGYEGFKIKVIALSPYPKLDVPIDPKDYEVTVVVTKDE